MILADCILPSRVNQTWQYTGIDSLERCLNKKQFDSYPYNIEYQYNSRGFRDHEWPDNLHSAIWCIGDSFTVGVGSPREHSWPYQLQSTTGIRTINVSMDGASNNWIAKKALKIIDEVGPEHMVLHWSYIERREDSVNSRLNAIWVKHYNTIKGPDWPSCPDIANYNTLPSWVLLELAEHDQSWKNSITDEDLRLGNIKSTWRDDITNTMSCITNIESTSGRPRNLIHSFIPDCAPATCLEFFQNQIDKTVKKYVPFFAKLDTARDGHHYDILTSQFLVHQITKLIDQ